MKRTLSTIATGLCTAGLALTTTAHAAPAAPPSTDHTFATSEVVLGGAWTVEFGSPISGNRHQVKLTTDNGAANGSIRSWYCPSGASITPRWVSSKCTHRQTITLKNRSTQPVGWVSSTERSATQKGLLTGYRGSKVWPFESDFTLKATGEPTDAGDDEFYSHWRDARPQGTFAGKPILAGSTRYGSIGAYGPR